MERLTHERNNGIKSGYWSPERKEDLVQRLAAYENTGLTPEDCYNYKMFEDECISNNVTFGRLLQMLRTGGMPTGWIPVDERLPETDEQGEAYVIICRDDKFISTADYSIDKGGFDLWGSEGDVVAWMPLPDPYRLPESNSSWCGICEYAAGDCPENGEWKHCERNFQIEQEQEQENANLSFGGVVSGRKNSNSNSGTFGEEEKGIY